MGDLGVFEAMANAGKISAEAAAKDGFELEKNIDRAIFRARDRFGAYLANSQSKVEFDERWSEVKPQVIKVIAEVTTPTPGVIRRVGAALRPSLPAQAATKRVCPSSVKTASEKERREFASAHRDEIILGPGQAIEPKDFTRVGATQKHAWTYDRETALYTSKDPMQKFACPGCGTEQDHLGFTHCGGCERTWNSWPVRQTSSEKTSASTYVLMAREIKMRGDQFKMAAAGNVKVATDSEVPWIADPVERAKLSQDMRSALATDLQKKTADAPMPQEPPPGMSQPSFGTMPGDNSAAMGAPVPPEQPPTPGGDVDNDQDIAGGVTEDSPLDQIQDALQDAIVALKDVQMLSINPALATTASTKVQKVAVLRTSMDRFWVLHKQLNYVAGMLAKEASEAIRTTDPRITSEAEFVQGYRAASVNSPLPPKTGRAWLEGYVAFFQTKADTYPGGADLDHITEPGDQDETTGSRNDGSYLGDVGLDDAANYLDGDAGPFDTSQPASREFASQMDTDNAQGGADRGQGSSGSIKPTSARRTVPKDKR